MPNAKSSYDHAAAPGGLARRDARRGAFRLDVLMLILTIVALIGVGVATVMVHDSYRQDEVYVQKIESLAERHYAEWTRLREASTLAFEPLGYRDTRGGISNYEAMNQQINVARNRQVEAYFVNEGAIDERDRTKGLAVEGGPASTSGRIEIKDVTAKKFDEFKTGNTSKATIKGLIAFQDTAINVILTKYLGDAGDKKTGFGSARDIERRNRAAAADAWNATRDQKVQGFDTARETVEGDIKRGSTALEGEENNETTAATSAENAQRESYDQIAGKAREVETKLEELADPRADAATKHDQAVTLLARRIRAESDDADFDGAVVEVDPVSGWVWIDLGQPDNVRAEMTFQVYRPVENQRGYRQIGEVRVKEVKAGGRSRCRIDVLDDPDVMVQKGDLLRNPGYSKEQYLVFAFLGEFGGNHTRYSKQQLSDVLYRYNKIVLPAPDNTVEVVILGGNWENDPLFDQLARTAGVNFETMKEEDVLYMFGLSGPEIGR